MRYRWGLITCGLVVLSVLTLSGLAAQQPESRLSPEPPQITYRIGVAKGNEFPTPVRPDVNSTDEKSDADVQPANTFEAYNFDDNATETGG